MPVKFFILLLCTCSVEHVWSWENVNVNLQFSCYESPDHLTICSFNKGYENCIVYLQVCVKSVNLKAYYGDKCNLFSKEFSFPNTEGKCIKGLHDTREMLSEKMNFKANLRHIHIYVHIHFKPHDDNKKLVDTLHYQLNSIGKLKFDLQSVEKRSKLPIQIKMKTKTECLDGFSGNDCETFCMKAKDFNCKSYAKPICSDWNKSNCSRQIIKENIDHCSCNISQSQDEKCDDIFISCLQKALNCTVDSRKGCASSNMLLTGLTSLSTNYFQINLSSIGLIVGGLLIIILILLISILLIWNKKLKIINKRDNDTDSYLYSMRPVIRPLPNPLHFSDVRDSDYIQPSGIYERMNYTYDVSGQAESEPSPIQN